MAADPTTPEGDDDDAPESAVLRRIAARDTSGQVGDDAAIVQVPTGRVVVTTDVAETGVHLHRTLTAWQSGYRAAACALSDLAAMAARPIAVTCTISAAPGCLDRADQVAAGVRARAREAGADLVGGDVTQLGSADAGDADHWVVSVTCIGEAPLEGVLRLDGGSPGDELYVTGPLGNGLAALARRDGRSGSDDGAPALLRADRHIDPPDRLRVAEALLERATACTDISDGLAAEVLAMAAASGCGAVIDLDAVPLHRADAALLGDDPKSTAAGASDDYELLVAMPAGSNDWVQSVCNGTDFAFSLMYVGSLADGEVVFRKDGSAVPAPRGYVHGSSD